MTENGSVNLLKLEMLSQPRLLAGARCMVGAVADRLGFSEPHCSQIALAVDEALCNVINHGYGQRTDGVIWITVQLSEARGGEPAELCIVIEDRADAVDPESIQSRDLDDIRPGGLGVHIIREVMDDVKYERCKPRGMRLTMKKNLPPTVHTEPAARLNAKQPATADQPERATAPERKAT